MATRKDIIITESAEELKQLFHKQPHHLHSRIKMLHYLQSNVTNKTKELSEKLLVSTTTILAWKNAYLSGGLKELLTYERGKHKTNATITPEINKVIVEQLSSPTSAFTSYVDLYHWLKENHLENITYRIVHHHTHTKLKASLKVARKSHIKKDAKVAEDFKKTLV